MPDITSRFESIASVKDTMKKFLNDVAEIGYISPVNGRCNNLVNDDDHSYNEYEGRRGIHGCGVERHLVQVMLQILILYPNLVNESVQIYMPGKITHQPNMERKRRNC